MENQGNQGFNEEQAREKISEEVRAELNSLGARILEQNEAGGYEMMRLVNAYKNKLIEHDKEVERINGRYKEEVANSKLAILEQDFRYDKQDFEQQIDKIIEQDQQRRLAEAQRLQADKDYKEAKNEAIKMLCMLKGAGVDIPNELYMDMITPLISAKDLKGLQVAKLLAGSTSNEYIIEKATDNINSYFANSELAEFGKSAKEFINTGEAEFTLSLYMAKFENQLRGDY